MSDSLIRLWFTTQDVTWCGSTTSVSLILCLVADNRLSGPGCFPQRPRGELDQPRMQISTDSNLWKRLFYQRLTILYSKILGSLQTMPQDAAYRRYTEQLVNDRLNHVKTVRAAAVGLPPSLRCWNPDTACSQEPDVQKLEQKINCGQIEEVIFQASFRCVRTARPRE